MSVIEIDCIFDAVQGKQNRVPCLGALEVIFQKYYYSLCHLERLLVLSASRS